MDCGHVLRVRRFEHGSYTLLNDQTARAYKQLGDALDLHYFITAVSSSDNKGIHQFIWINAMMELQLQIYMLIRTEIRMASKLWRIHVLCGVG